MTSPTSHTDHHAPHAHPHRQKQLAKRLESLVSVGMAVVAVGLLAVAGFAILGGAPQVPLWMR